MNLLTILTLVVTLNGAVGFAPFPLVVKVRFINYDGAICVSVDGPEFHRSCTPRGRGSAPVREFRFHLGTPGEYAITTEDATGKLYHHPTIKVLGE